MPSVYSTPLLHPITNLFQSNPLKQLQSQATSTYSFVFRRWTPKHWAAKTILYSFRWLAKLSFKALRLGVKYSGIFLLLKLLWRHFRLLVTLLTTQIVWTNFVSRYYYIIMNYLHGVLNPSQREKRQELSARIESAGSYPEWAYATSQLDELDGLTTWKMENASPHYDYQRLERYCSILLHLYLTENSPAIMLLLSSHLSRNFCGILNPELYNMLGVGTKQLIEDYIQLVHNSLELVSQDESIPLSERLSFFSKLRHVFGRTGFLLSGGATLSLMHTGVMVELIRAGLCPAVISGSSGGSILGCLLAARTDREFLDTIVNDPGQIFTYMYYPEQISQRHLQMFGPLPNFPLRPRNTLFDIRILQHAIRQIIPSNATFLDLYHHSGGRIFNVVIHSSTLASGFFVANYLTAPHVYVASAVSASCALPGVFEPAPILYSQTYTKLTLSYLRGKLGALVQQQLSAVTGGTPNDATSTSVVVATPQPATSTSSPPPPPPPASSSATPKITVISDSQTPPLSITTPQQRPLNTKAIDPTLIHDSLKPLVDATRSPPKQTSTTTTTTTGAQSKPEMKSLFDNDLTESEHQSITALFGDTRLYQDGSLGADLPFDVLKEQFGVNFSVVSQVNPHIAPLLKCFPSFYPNYSNRPFSISFVTHAMNLSLHIIEYLFSSFRSLILNLTEAKLLPWFPSTLRSMLSQTYSGDMTILPAKLQWEDYKTAINNPTVESIVKYRDDAIKHTWRYLTRLKIASKIETQLQKISYSLRVRYQSQPVYGPSGKPTGISSLGSSAQLNYYGQPQTTTLCRIQSSTDKSLALPKSPGLKQSSSLNGIHKTNQAKGNNQGPAHGSLDLSDDDLSLTINNPNTTTTTQPTKISTLTRRSSFFRQTYIDDKGDNSSGTSKSGQSNPIPNPEDFRNVNDADPSEYYDPDCYLYEDDPTPPSTPPVQNDDTKSNGANDNDQDGAIIPIQQQLQQQQQQPQSTPLQPLPVSLLSPQSTISNGDLSESGNFLGISQQQQQQQSNQLRSKHNNSFYRIKSSFGSIDPTSDPSTLLSPPLTPSKMVNTILLPVNGSNNPNSYQYLNNNNNQQHYHHLNSYNNNNNNTIVAGLPRNLSHGSSISSVSQYQPDNDGSTTPGIYPQQPHQLDDNATQHISQYLTSPQLYHSPSDDSSHHNGQFYPSHGELAFEQF